MDVFTRRRVEDAARLEERLARLEWSGTRLADPKLRGWKWLLWRLWGRPVTENCCPVCQVTPYRGHRPDCWLGQELHPRRRGHDPTAS